MSAFRKRQKAMLAVLGIVCMFGFVIGPSLMDVLGGSRGPEDPVVVTTKYGKLRLSEVQSMQGARQVVNRFVGDLLGAATRRPQPQQPLGDDSQESVVNTMLMARRAQDMGVTVSNKAINEFLKQITEDKVTQDQLREVINAQRNVSDKQLYDMLRHELMARRYLEMAFVGMSGLTPAERWEYFLRQNRKAKTQIVAVPVADFVPLVPDPTDEVLSAFFDEHKERLPDPASPTPGFKVPKKLAFEYLRADFEKFQAAAEVTDEEIADYYEKNKATRFKKLALPEIDPVTPATTDGDEPADGTEGAGAGEPAEEGPPDTGDFPIRVDVTADEEGPADESVEPAPAEDDPAEEETEPTAEPADADPEAAAPEDTDTESTDPESTEPDAAPSDGDSSARPRLSDLHSALALADEALALADEADPAADTAEADAASDETADESDTAGEPAEGAAEEPVAADEPEPAETEDDPLSESDEAEATDEAAAPDEPSEAAGAVEPADEGDTEGPAAGAGVTPPPEYKPLEEVRDQIRRELADRKAQERIAEIFKDVKQALDGYFGDRRLWEAHGVDEPKRPDFDALAEQYGLTAHSTELVTAAELEQSTDIGKSRYQGRADMWQFAYFSNLQPFKAAQSVDAERNHYLFWMTAEEAERVPELSDPAARAEVVKAFKSIEARTLARKRAEELAAQAEGKTLPEALADVPSLTVVEPPPFSWMSQGFSMFGLDPSRINEVEGVEHVGEEFMKTVFALEKGEVAVAFNEPQSVCYVVRLEGTEPSEVVLQQEFLASRLEMYADSAMPDQQRVSREWVKKLQEEAGLDWDQPADELAAAGQ
jgi:hypothetical protein